MITVNCKSLNDNNFVNNVIKSIKRNDDFINIEINCSNNNLIISEIIVNKKYRNKGIGTFTIKTIRHLCNLCNYNFIIYPISSNNKLFNRNIKWLGNCNLIKNIDSEGFIYFSNNKLKA
jgi:hypothetical protein